MKNKLFKANELNIIKYQEIIGKIKLIKSYLKKVKNNTIKNLTTIKSYKIWILIKFDLKNYKIII